MGTRNLVVVYYGGKFRIAQYGQWDGYPEGQDKDVLEFLKTSGNNDKLREVLDAGDRLIFPIDAPTVSEIETLYECHPALRHGTGAQILTLALAATEEDPMPVVLQPEFAVDGIFCEWVWVVDLDANVFEGYGGCLCSCEDPQNRFAEFGWAGDTVPRIVCSFTFDNLPRDVNELVEVIAEVQKQHPDQ